MDQDDTKGLFSYHTFFVEKEDKEATYGSR
jgi:hypothetical protein